MIVPVRVSGKEKKERLISQFKGEHPGVEHREKQIPRAKPALGMTPVFSKVRANRAGLDVALFMTLCSEAGKSARVDESLK